MSTEEKTSTGWHLDIPNLMKKISLLGGYIGAGCLLGLSLMRFMKFDTSFYEHYVLTLTFVIIAGFMVADNLEITLVTEYFKFITTYTGKAFFYLIMAAVLLAEQNIEFLSKFMGLGFLGFGILMMLFACLDSEACHSKGGIFKSQRDEEHGDESEKKPLKEQEGKTAKN